MKAILTVGISGSGKTTWARRQHEFININRDDIRFPDGIVDWSKWDFSPDNEVRVTREQNNQIDNAASLGLDIIVSDTHLSPFLRKKMIRRLKELGYEVELKLFSVRDLDLAIHIDSTRGTASVGEEVLRKQWSRWEQFLNDPAAMVPGVRVYA